MLEVILVEYLKKSKAMNDKLHQLLQNFNEFYLQIFQLSFYTFSYFLNFKHFHQLIINNNFIIDNFF